MMMTTAEAIMATGRAVLAALCLVALIAASSAYFHVPLDGRPCVYEGGSYGTVVGKVSPGYRVCHHGDPDARPVNLGFWP